MTSADNNQSGFRDGLESSRGDPRILAVINAILSTLFAWLVVFASDIVGIVSLTATNVIVVAIGVFLLTHVMTRSS